MPQDICVRCCLVTSERSVTVVWPVSLPGWPHRVLGSPPRYLCLGNAGVASGERDGHRDHPLIFAGGGQQDPLLVTGSVL